MNFLPVIFLQTLTYTLGSQTQNSILPATSNMVEENVDTGMRQQREIVGIYKECLSNNEKSENNNKLDKDYLISAHWGSTTSGSIGNDEKIESSGSERKENCLHKYKTFKFTEATTHWATMEPPQTATYRILNPNPYCKQYHAVDKSKKPRPKDIPLDLPVIIHSRNGL